MDSNKIIQMLQDQSFKIEALGKNLIATKTVLTLDEMCQYTGLSKSYAYKLTSSRKIPHSNPSGKCLYFAKDEIDKWLLRNPVKTMGQLSKEIKSNRI